MTRSRTIARPRKEVWAVLADFGGLAAWADNADHTCLLHAPDGDPIGIGTERRVQAGRMTLVERVTTSEAPEVLAYAIEGLPPVVKAVTNEWRLTPEGDSSTVVALTSTIDCGPRPPQQLVARIVGLRLAKASDTMLSGLAATLEEAPHA
ncbi:MAG: SRPBCC family protein [Iamia sp.]